MTLHQRLSFGSDRAGKQCDSFAVKSGPFVKAAEYNNPRHTSRKLVFPTDLILGHDTDETSGLDYVTK